jgi:hypothetical protein
MVKITTKEMKANNIVVIPYNVKNPKCDENIIDSDRILIKLGVGRFK